jgi:hypothetical protein
MVLMRDDMTISRARDEREKGRFVQAFPMGDEAA